MRSTRILVLALLLSTLPTVAPAVERGVPEIDNRGAKLFLHAIPMDQVQRINCFTHGVRGPQDVVVHDEVGDPPREYLVYVLIGDFDTEAGLTGIQFGIAYDPEDSSGVDVLSWQDCALLEWHAEDWPQAGSGNLLTWNIRDDCQTDVPVVVGMFHIRVYSSDRFLLTPRPSDGQAMVAACGSSGPSTSILATDNLGWLGFGDVQGYNPWDPEQNLIEIRKRVTGKSGR